MANEKLLILVDGHAIVYKHYFGFIRNPLISKGQNVSGVFGTAHTILKVLNFFPLTHIAVIFDPPGGSFRKALYPEYKENRQKQPDVYPQIDKTYQLMKAWGIYTNAFANYEADDIIGSIATKAAADGFKVFILTKDKDYIQLMCDNITLIDLGEKISETDTVYLNETYVMNKFGIKPSQMLDYLSLVGDTGDNVKGIPGIGPKTAVGLLAEYGSVENIYKNVGALPPKIKEKFEQHQKEYELSRKLVTIVRDVQCPFTWDDLKKPDRVRPELVKMLEDLEFETVLRGLNY